MVERTGDSRQKTGNNRLRIPPPPVFCVSVGSIGLTGESLGCVGMIGLRGGWRVRRKERLTAETRRAQRFAEGEALCGWEMRDGSSVEHSLEAYHVDYHITIGTVWVYFSNEGGSRLYRGGWHKSQRYMEAGRQKNDISTHRPYHSGWQSEHWRTAKNGCATFS